MFELKLSFLPYKSTRKAYIFQTNPQLFYQHTATTLLPPSLFAVNQLQNTFSATPNNGLKVEVTQGTYCFTLPHTSSSE